MYIDKSGEPTYIRRGSHLEQLLIGQELLETVAMALPSLTAIIEEAIRKERSRVHHEKASASLDSGELPVPFWSKEGREAQGGLGDK